MRREENAGHRRPMPVLVYDGDCGLCNRCVRLLLRMDRRSRLHFAPLQGGPAQLYLRAQGLPAEDFESMIFVPDWGRPLDEPPRFRTDAALEALRVAGGPGRVLACLRVIPRAWRDWLYRGVARARYRWFGEYGPKPLPRPEWTRRFLA